jgi:transposase InsO family protein
MGMASTTMGSVDYTGPFLNKMFLVVVDAYSKWLEGVIVPSATSLNIIQALRSMFATHGLPESLVSDNGTAFTSSEFREFLKQNEIQRVTSAPYNPSSNGLAERAVQPSKQG